MVNYFSGFQRFDRDIRLFLISELWIGFSFAGIHNVLFNLYLVRLGFGPELIGLVLGITQIAHAAFCLPAGALGTRWSNRRMLIAGVIVTAVGLGLVPMAELLPQSSHYPWIIFAYTFTWLGATLYVVNVGPYVMGASQPHLRAHVFAIRAALQPLAVIMGSILAGLLTGLTGSLLEIPVEHSARFGYPLLFSAIILLLCALILKSTAEPLAPAMPMRTATVIAATTHKLAGPITLILVMSLIVYFRAASEGAGKNFFNLYLDTSLQMPTMQIGLMIAAGQLLAIPVTLALPFLLKRLGKQQTVIFGFLGVVVSLLPLALIPHWGAASLAYMAFVATTSLNQPVFILYTQEAVSPPWRATMSGAVTMATGLGTSTVSIYGGYLIAAQGFQTLWLSAALIALIALVLIWASQRWQHIDSPTLTPLIEKE